MKAWLQRFMTGRYGADALNRFLNILCLVFLVLGFLWRGFYWVGIVVLVLSYYRMFSRNIQARYRENLVYYQYQQKVRNTFNNLKARIAGSKTHRYFRCPSCGQQLRVPRGRGRIAITCPKCHTEFIKKT